MISMSRLGDSGCLLLDLCSSIFQSQTMPVVFASMVWLQDKIILGVQIGYKQERQMYFFWDDYKLSQKIGQSNLYLFLSSCFNDVALGQIKDSATAIILFYIMNIEKDSVVNFLTPTKLVQGTFKPRQKVNLNESQYSNSTSKNKPQTVMNNNSLNKFPNDSLRYEQSFQKNLGRDEDIYINEIKQKKKPSERNVMLYDTSKTVLRSEDNFKLLVEDKQNMKIAALQKNEIVTPPVQQEINPPVGEVLAKISSSYKNSRVESIRPEENSKNMDFSRSRKEQPLSYNPSNQGLNKWQGSIDELNKLMQVLKGVRDSLDSQLNNLQQILDNTSKYLADMNEQYLRVKQRILDYTAQVLDASFTRYKQNMVNWSKYEQVEKKTIVIKSQLERTIKQNDMIVKEMNKSKATRLTIGKQQEIEQTIEFYGGYVNELQMTNEQCLRMHPQLRKDRIAAFEQALAELADF